MKSLTIAAVLTAAFCFTLNAEAPKVAKNDVVFELKNGKTNLAGKSYGKWTFKNGAWENAGTGWETLTSSQHSARKKVYARAEFTFDPKAKGAAGIQIGDVSWYCNRGWGILYYPAEKAVKICYLSYQKGKVNVSVRGTLKNVEGGNRMTMEIVHDKGSYWTIKANGKSMGFPFCIPIFQWSGVTAIDMKAKFTSFRIEGIAEYYPVMAFGDSITHHCRWQDKVSQKLGVKIGNAGAACEGSKTAVKRFETDVCGMGAKKVFILIGTNNASPKTAVQDIAEMVKIARRHGVKVAVCELLPRTDSRDVQTFNKEIRKFAAQEKLLLVDWFHVLADKNGRVAKQFGGIHPNNAGTEALANYIASKPELVKFIKD